MQKVGNLISLVVQPSLCVHSIAGAWANSACSSCSLIGRRLRYRDDYCTVEAIFGVVGGNFDEASVDHVHYARQSQRGFRDICGADYFSDWE